jgi:DNA repair exonuclease SbcCD ATPase subunit
MDLDQLHLTAQSVQTQRHQNFDELCEAGFAQLEHCQAVETLTTVQSQTITTLFQQAQRLRPQSPEPCLGLAYLALLEDQPQVALFHLERGLELAPTDTTLQTMQQQAQARLAEIEAAGERHPSVMDEGALRTYLRDQVRALMEIQVPSPTQEPEILRQATAQWRYWRQVLTDVQRRVAELEPDTDTLALQQWVSPLESGVRRWQQLIDSSQQRQGLQHTITALTEEVQGLYRAVDDQQGTRSEWETRLESLLDRCDLLADDLDALDATGQDIGLLMPGYEFLSFQLEGLRDYVDEQD